jgi:hypothetical protein
VHPVHPVSNGQGLQQELKGLAARNACTARDSARTRRWKLVRDLRAVEERISRKLSNMELMLAFNEWHRLSQPFLDTAKTRDDYLAAFLAELGKVRVPTGEGHTLNQALENVSTLAPSELPLIPDYPNAPESWRILAALHRELSRLTGGNTYFLTCRDAAKAVPGFEASSSVHHQSSTGTAWRNRGRSRRCATPERRESLRVSVSLAAD